MIEEFPRRHSLRCLKPDIRCVHPARHLIARILQSLIDDFGILHVISDLLLKLRLPGFGIHGLPRLLHDIRRSVIFGSMTSRPQGMEHNLPALHILRDHRCAKPHAREPGILREASKLDSTGSRPLALVDTVRHILLGNVRLIGRVIDNDRSDLVGIIHPFLELRLRDGRSSRIIGKTQIDNVRSLFRKLRRKIRLLRTRHIDHIAPGLLIRIIGSCAPRHHIRIHIDRIDRVAYSDLIILRKDLLDIAGIALGSVRDEHLIRLNIAPSVLIIILRHGVS